MQLRRSPTSAHDEQHAFDAVLENMHLIAVMLDRNAVLTYCNEYFLRLTGWRSEEILHRNWFEVFVPPEDQELRGVFAALIDGCPSAWYHENPILTKSGEWRFIRWNNTSIRDRAGSVTGAASIGEDITDRRHLERSLLEASTREQARLAMEIHDGLGQDLFGISLLARSIAASAKKEGSALADELLRLSNIAVAAMDTCRTMARGLSPLSSIQGGIAQALRQIAKMPSGWVGPAVRYELIESAPLQLSPDTVDHIYRIAQEGLTNALRHSRATLITMRLEISPSKVHLEIVDDGIGLRPSAAAKGLGLKTMQYRANLMNADFSCLNAIPRGARMICEVRQPVSR